jgi:hypothetical protein
MVLPVSYMLAKSHMTTSLTGTRGILCRPHMSSHFGQSRSRDFSPLRITRSYLLLGRQSVVVQRWPEFGLNITIISGFITVLCATKKGITVECALISQLSMEEPSE